MIVCVCNRINERMVSDAVDAGAQTGACVYAHHGCSVNCGSCEDAMDDAVAVRHYAARQAAE